MFQEEAIDLSEAKSFSDIETVMQLVACWQGCQVVEVGDAVDRKGTRQSGPCDQMCSD